LRCERARFPAASFILIFLNWLLSLTIFVVVILIILLMFLCSLILVLVSGFSRNMFGCDGSIVDLVLEVGNLLVSLI
jgi:hypothetical protein